MSADETDHSNTEATVEGELDAAWSSDLADRDVKSSPPPESVEYATAPDEQQGDTAFEFLPEGVERDDLTDLQADIIRTAVLRDPDSFNDLGRMVDCSGQNVNKTLSRYAPDLAEQVKMDPEEALEGNRYTGPAKTDDSEHVDDEDDEDDPEPEPVTVDGYGDVTADHPAPRLQPRRVERAIEAAETIEAVSESAEAQNAAQHIREILEDEEGADD